MSSPPSHFPRPLGLPHLRLENIASTRPLWCVSKVNIGKVACIFLGRSSRYLGSGISSQFM